MSFAANCFSCVFFCGRVGLHLSVFVETGEGRLTFLPISSTLSSTMSRSSLSSSTRKFLRREKARIRRGTLATAEAERRIKDLVERIFLAHSKEKGQRKKEEK